VEFWQPSETLEAMLKQTEAARIMRIDRLKDFVRINAERLAKLKEELRTLPEQIAKWEAERAHLEASTAVGLVMGQEVPKPAAVEVLPEFRAIKDIPYAMFKAYDGVWLDPAGNRVANVMDPERQIRPRDTTFTELVEAMADAREKQGEPAQYACDFCRDGQRFMPGFREFVLDAMSVIGERPRAGDLHSMHMAYKAGLEYGKETTDAR
jgi:hypothetical protein